jgi:hypothetical protein
LIAVVDGRHSLIKEVQAAPNDLSLYLIEAMRVLLDEPRFLDALPGYLLPDSASQSRIALLLSKLQELSNSK